jgi:nucleoside diphosphate kinase
VSPLLTTHDGKRLWYGRDTYFIECLEQVCGLTDDVIEFAHGCAVLLLKPEAVVTRQLIPAVDWLGANGFRVVAAEPVRLTRTMVRALWYFQWNLATPQRRRLADLLVEMGDCLVVVVRCADRPPLQPASVLLTTLKGPANPQARSPGQLRHLLGGPSYLLNVAHTADEPADVLRELGVYFDE